MVDPRQKKLLIEIMESDANDGLYDNHNLTALEWFYNELKRHKLIQLPLTKGPNMLFEKAKAMEERQSQLYAAFCLKCVREELKLLQFKDFAKL